jgi:hypothetical protein
MIIIKIHGGLGNQLFQWSFGKYLSEISNHDIKFDISFYQNTSNNNTKRHFYLSNYPLIGDYFAPNTDLDNYNIIYDNFFYREFELKNQQNYYFDGYWQSEKYFKKISSVIKKSLLSNSITLSNLRSKIKKNSVSLHVRRGDYLTSDGAHTVLPIEYYRMALEKIDNYENIYVFSDDIEWCKKNIKFDKVSYVENNDNPIDDLLLMSLCDHNVISNSTFSWWAAWLNTNNDKKIIAPKNWFGPKLRINSSDIIPDSWIVI